MILLGCYMVITLVNDHIVTLLFPLVTLLLPLYYHVITEL